VTGRTRAARPGRSLAQPWLEWAAENLARGAPPAEVETALVEEGASATLARRTVEELTASPVMAAARRLARGSGRLGAVTRLIETLRHGGPGERLARIPWPGGDELLARYWETNTPVVLTGLVSSWPAMESWQPERLVARLGEAQVDVTVGRDGDPDYDMNTPRHTARMPLRDYVARVLAAGESNDLYMVANNRNLAKELGPLLSDVRLPEDLFRTESLASGAAFWLGPAGTVTPLHHDTSNILFCQVIGRKAYKMVAPTETRLLDDARAMYAAVDPEQPDLARFPWWPEVKVVDDVIEPGEALFIPVGWWHHVRALDVSVSLAVNAFRRANGFDWYVPGSI
jgi:hypothetical protein